MAARNLDRRHLTASQRAAASVPAIEYRGEHLFVEGFPAMNGMAWEGVARSPSVLLVKIHPSNRHCGYYHYAVTDVRAGSMAWSRKPVLGTSVREFLKPEIADWAIQWSASSVEPTDEWDFSIKRSTQSPLIYFAKAGPFVKIGKASGESAEWRIATLQTGCPYEIELLATESGGHQEERALHRRFSEFHERGEWFRLEGALLDYIRSIS